MKGSKNTIEKEEEILELIKLNLKNNEIVTKLLVSLSTIKRVKKKHSLQNHRVLAFKDKYLYLHKLSPKLDNKQIAKELKCSKAFIFLLQKEAGLKSNYEKVHDYKLNLFQLSCLVGTVMGDANISIGSKASARGSFSHVKRNLDYVKYKRDLLYPISLDKIYIKPVAMINAEEQRTCGLKSCPLLRSIYEKIYIDGKRLTPFVLQHFTDASLALYYMDDGTKKYNRYSKYYSYFIAMCSFTTVEKQSLVDLLFKKWNIYATVQKTGIYIRSKSKEKFKYLIKPYIVPSMKYKL